MSSTITSENWSSLVDNEYELFEGIQVLSNDNSAFLVSFMDELHDHVEEGDEERLNSVIQSLEAEINHSSTNNMIISDHDHMGGLGQIMDGHDYLVSLDDLDMDGLIDVDVVPDCSSSTAGDELNWYMYTNGDENMSTTNDNYYASQILWQEPTYMIQ